MKVPNIGFPQGTHPTTYEFFGWVRSVLNEGRYQLRVINSAPTWTTNDGEILAVDDDSGKSLYLFVTDTWYSVPLTTAGTGGTVPTGGVIPFAGPTTALPNGWALCNGAAASRTTYASLFSVIGTAFGSGDGSTTFNLPDLRGYFVRGAGTNGDGVASDTFGAKQADELKSHTHTSEFYGGALGAPFTGPFISQYSTPANQNTLATGGTETRPRNIAMLACIKT